ncbi:hypothetical protein B0H63DRAFT_530231 [Podospora didyma]|uniref:Uncharacterized protein n=1 Tax=Podospora didyma TaxID=330526 RepID=A0AAE0P3T4_9PEZI|nr:hypothetical protein B0H63DRAFT_530231 [Podospora didyma]
MANKSQVDDPFSKEVLRFRAETPPGDKSYMTYWFDDGTKYGSAVVSSTFPIDGDDICPLDCCLEHPGLIEDDSEDVKELVTKLPLVRVDPAKHFAKKGKFRSEIENLIKCQGGSVPGHPLSPNIIQLLGRSADGELVFEKLSSSARTLGRFHSLAVYRSRILQLIDALDR